MPPLAGSVLRTVLPLGRKNRLEDKYIVMPHTRLYADLSPLLRHPIGRSIASRMVQISEPRAIIGWLELSRRKAFLARGKRFNTRRLLPAALPFIPRVVHSLPFGDVSGFWESATSIIEETLSRAKARLDTTVGEGERQ